MYTTTVDVKKEAGLFDNDSILDQDVEMLIQDAQCVVDGYLIGKYTVPFSDYPASPPLIERITRGIAASYLLLREYGPMNPGDAKDGDSKEKQMMSMLAKIQKGTLVLVDDNGVSLLSKDNMATSYFPTDADSSISGDSVQNEDIGAFETAQSDSGNGGPYIRMGTKW